MYRGVFQLNTKEVDAHDTPQHKLPSTIAFAASTTITEEKRKSTHVLLFPDSDQALPPHNKENNSKGRSSWWNKKQKTCVLFPLFILYEHYERKHSFLQVLFLSILYKMKKCQNRVRKTGVSAVKRHKMC